MNRSRPTIAELRSRVQKDRHREIGNVLARRFARPTAVYGSWLAIRMGLSAHQVTLAALTASLAAAIAIGSASRTGFITGVLLAHLGFWLDHVDGQVARWRGTVSLDGVYFDYLMHHATSAAMGFALGYGLAMSTGDIRWTIAGFAIATGWGLLSLHNDCRYKAFFQRLKTATGSYRIDGGSGGRPSPPAPWPRRGRAAITWPAFKVCEFHVTLISLTVVAAVAIVLPTIWMTLWQYGVILLAVLTPVLAIGRIARSIKKNTVETEFAHWFQPPGSELEEADEQTGLQSARRYPSSTTRQYSGTPR